jgi:uncharacterized membrane protein
MLKYCLLGSLIGIAVACALFLVGMVASVIAHTSDPYVTALIFILFIAGVIGAIVGYIVYKDK